MKERNLIYANWFETWGWIALVCLVVLIVLIVILSLVLRKVKIKTDKAQSEKQNSTFLEIFGGENNIVSCEAKGSRLVLVLKDYSKLNEEKLKENGVTSLIKATSKVTLIIGEKSKELETFINERK